MLTQFKTQLNKGSCLLPMALSAALLVGCGTSDPNDEQVQEDTSKSISLDMDIPSSLTGGEVQVIQSQSYLGVQAQAAGVPCAYTGADEEDPFRNGYEMTKFMVSAVATWTCLADIIIEVADVVNVEHNGVIHETDNDTMASNYDADDPTHYSIEDDSDTQTTVRMYYGYDRDVPPLQGEDPQFYISWNEDENGDIQGRMIINGVAIDPENNNAEDPGWMRMDFSENATEKLADMFLKFENGNEWAEGFRIEVAKDLTTGPLGKVFVARGLMDMKAQFVPVEDVDALPELAMYTVSDELGSGAAIAKFLDVTLPLVVNEATNNHLGNYLFDKEDTYVFDWDGDPDWINKTFTKALYVGGRTTLETGGPVDDPSLDRIGAYLLLGETYFQDKPCLMINDDCVEMLNAIFQDGFYEQEPNEGEDPMDWRSNEIADPQYLETVYPNGVDWEGAFDFSFTPDQ